MNQSHEWIAFAARELLEKNIVPSDAHAEAAMLIIRANYEAYLKHCKPDDPAPPA